MPTREEIALAAFAATPRRDGETEEDWGARVAVNAQAIHGLLQSNDKHESPILAAIGQVENATVIKGTIVQIVPNPVTRRWDVILYSDQSLSAKNGQGKTAKVGGREVELPPGYEVIATEPEWKKAPFEAIRPQILAGVGKRCLLWKDVESFTDKTGMTKKARVLRRVKPLGTDEAFTLNTPEGQLPFATPAR